MNSEKLNHSLVVVKNKLFVISNKEHNICEVFDNVCKKFISINSPEFTSFFFGFIRCHSIENKIFVLLDERSKILSYDINKSKWSEESYEVTKNIRLFSSVKVPCL